MSNTLLTVDMITKESLRILHQKLMFVGNINRQYDDSFAVEGAKIGSQLRIRLPNQYKVRTGATISAQDTTEKNIILPVDNQVGVDMNFTSVDLTMDMESFSRRIIQPAMSVLAAHIENDVLFTLSKDVYNIVDNDGSALTFLNALNAGVAISNDLAPLDQRTLLLDNASQATIVDALKGLFNDNKEVSNQYVRGMMGNTAGFDWGASTFVSPHQTGTAAKTTGYQVDGAAQSGTSITVDTGSTTFLVGDIVTFVGVNRVHQETKVDSGELQKFVVTADSGASTTSLAISPELISDPTDAYQNVTASPADNALVVKVAAGANETIQGNLAFHKDAFTFATADLVMPDGVDFKSRQVFEGISMRIIRAYDINNDKFPTRLDVLYGSTSLYPQWAARVHADG